MQNITDTTVSVAAAPCALFERAALLAAITFLAGTKPVIESGNTIPIVGHILIEPVDGGARLSGTDLDMVFSTVVPAVWEAPGSFTADAKGLLAAVKGCGDDMVTIAKAGGYARVSGGAVAANVESFSASDFPHVQPFEGGASFTLDGAQLASDLSRCMLSVSYEETRYYLNGVLFHAVQMGGDAPPVMRMATTDGHRMTRITRPLPVMVDGAELPDSIVPRKLVQQVLKALGKKPSGAVSMRIGACKCQIELPGWSVLAKLIDGSFPDYSRVIPIAPERAAIMNGAKLAKALADVLRGSAKEDKTVKLSVSAIDGATVSQNTKTRQAAAGLSAHYCDKTHAGDEPAAFAIGFNGTYLAAFADAAGDSDLSIGFGQDAGCPVLIEMPDAPEYTGVLMPMRIDGVVIPEKAEPEPVPTPSDVFKAAYAAAFVANDGAAMRACVEIFRASDYFGNADNWPHGRDHTTLAMICAQIRRDNSAHLSDAKGVALAAAAKRAVRKDSARCQLDRPRGYFARLRSREADIRYRAEQLELNTAKLATLPGYRADDPRELLPIVTDDAKRRFVLAVDMADLSLSYLQLYKASGERVVSRRGSTTVHREDIAKVIQPSDRQPRAAAAVEPSADVVALLETVRALTERVADMEATIASISTVPCPVVAAEPLPAPSGSNDGRDAYIATLIAERDAARAEAAEATDRAESCRAWLEYQNGVLERFDAKLERATGARRRTAQRIVAYRARLATRQVDTGLVDAMAKDLDAARGELARLQPVAAAIAAMAAAAAQPLTGNVVAFAPVAA